MPVFSYTGHIMIAKIIKKVYLVGIGGIGISALARYFLSEGWQVSGSDLSPSDTTKELQKEGVKVYIGKHSEKNLKSFVEFTLSKSNGLRTTSETLVVYNQAIQENNPELLAAKKLGIPCQTYPEAVGELTKKYKTIAIAGSHGKSTTTALVSLMLIAAGFDPMVIIGTKLKEFSPGVLARSPGVSRGRRGNLPSMGSPLRQLADRDDSYGVNFRKGKSPSTTANAGQASSGQDAWLVLEADEWKASFLNYSPTLAIITNIDKEHLDFYKTFTNVKRSFQKFIKNILPDGTLFINGDHSNVLKNIRMRPSTVIFSESNRVAEKIKKVLQVPGRHNVLNALAAYSVGRYLKIPEKIILKALSEYRGAWRRMEYRGKFKIKNLKLKISVYDDYAHHPTEIKATLAGLKEKYPKNAIICVFQAHQAQRLKLLFKDFKTAFKDADRVIILPTYEVAGRENAVIGNSKLVIGKTSEKLAKAIGATYVKNPKRELKKVLKTLLAKTLPTGRQAYWLNPIIVMMGAGDIVNLTDFLIVKQHP